MKAGLDLYRQNRLLTDNWRALEAGVFRQVAFDLRQGRQTGGADLVRAIANARVLWVAVHDLVCEPGNRLPDDLRKNLASLAETLVAEMNKPQPEMDIDLLLTATVNVAEGLEGAPGAASADRNRFTPK